MKWKAENLKPVAISWIITIIFLFIVTIYNVITKESFGITGIIFFASMGIYFLSYIIFKKRYYS